MQSPEGKNKSPRSSSSSSPPTKATKDSSPNYRPGRRHADSVSSVMTCSSLATPSLTCSSTDSNTDHGYSCLTEVERLSLEDKVLSMFGGSVQISREQICRELGDVLPMRWIDGLTVAAQPTWEMTNEIAKASVRASDIMVDAVDKEVALVGRLAEHHTQMSQIMLKRFEMLKVIQKDTRMANSVMRRLEEKSAAKQVLELSRRPPVVLADRSPIASVS
ncbi:hypothetical protein BJ138DRAFT_1120938 [Hygrophoropsis aurantiaca]|uniref:Uncharacterized protein n=1 Tax=Hygrophoropsis aurantiaca TaxID=72124 RepID=A0ACB7ZRF4_9AGAM|nr:hypothetical protein BJ138DRAFT_1120938 [Hygrophoropsis aurantiaca]